MSSLSNLSNYGRLLQWGRNTVKVEDFGPAAGYPPLRSGASRARRIENFITESLSLAISSDWHPIVAALGDLRSVGNPNDIARVATYTQQRVGPTGKEGIVDLILAIEHESGAATETWVEVKAGAPVSTKQIRAYKTAIRDAADEDLTVRDLVVLDRYPYRDPDPDPELPKVIPLTWQQLHGAITQSHSPLWRDFKTFVAERRLDQPSGVVRPELPADSAEMVAEILSLVVKDTGRWSFPWPRGQGNDYMLRKTLRTAIAKEMVVAGDQAIRIYAPNQFTSLELGVFVRDRASLGVRLVISWWYPVAHEVLRRKAIKAKLDAATWETMGSRDNDVIAAAYRPFVEGDSVADAARWMIERVDDLGVAGLLLDVDGNGRE